jgi:hypothetical protein
MGEMRNACSIWLENLNGKKLLGRPRHRWVYNIGMDLRKQGGRV